MTYVDDTKTKKKNAISTITTLEGFRFSEENT